MAGLGSLSANGLACLMMVFGSHRRRRSRTRPRRRRVGPAIALEPVDRQQDVDGARSEKVVQLRPAGSGKRRAKAADKAAPDAIKQAKRFMVARVTRTDGDAETDVRDLHRDYVTWCEAGGVPAQAGNRDRPGASPPVRDGADPDRPEGRKAGCAGNCPQILTGWKGSESPIIRESCRGISGKCFQERFALRPDHDRIVRVRLS